jgi:MFS family permease
MEGRLSHPDRTDDRPATFREVLASGEFRAVYAATALSWFGDYLARAAVTALVFQQTRSVTASAAAFAISYLPWLGIGPVLAALVERYPFRRVMIGCDLIRMVLIALVALPGLPVHMMIVLLFLAALLNPPFDAARSALLPRILDGDRYVVGVALNATTNQCAQIIGYLFGATLGAFDPQLALLLNAATFGISAFLVGLGVHERPAVPARSNRAPLLRETADGFKIVFGNTVLRAIALLIFSTVLFTVVPEGLAAAWAATLSTNDHDRGWIQGVIMMSYPVGFALGGLGMSRLVTPSVRRRLILPLAILAPLALVPSLFRPPVFAIAAMTLVCGIATAGVSPVSNGLFVQALPDGFRARAFGVVMTGIQLMQATAVFATGWLSDRFPLPAVVGTWSVAGVVLLTMVSLSWPSQHRFTEAVAMARAGNATNAAARSAAVPAGAGDSGRHPGEVPQPAPTPAPSAAVPLDSAASSGEADMTADTQELPAITDVAPLPVNLGPRPATLASNNGSQLETGAAGPPRTPGVGWRGDGAPDAGTGQLSPANI